MRTGTAHLPLHGGKAPRWLFTRVVALSRQMLRVMVEEYGPGEVLTRVSDPHWFQALGFDPDKLAALRRLARHAGDSR